MFSISNSTAESFFSTSTGIFYKVLAAAILSVVSLTILQDFLEAKRLGYHFYFSESLLFKVVWFLYIPIITILFRKLKNEIPDTYTKTLRFIAAPILAHVLILPCIAQLLTILFFNNQYDLFKFFTYTLTHDFYTIVLIYTGFVLVYRYLRIREKNAICIEKRSYHSTLLIHNGPYKVIVQVEDILQITSATPYVSIHLENKKYLYTETLKSIHEQLDNSIFLRVHKSALVNLSKVSSFKSRLNGDYDLQLTDGSVTRLSRTYAADFKERFKVASSG